MAAWAWRWCTTPEALPAEFEKVTGFAGRLFGDPSVFVERFFPSVRHVEIQILGLADGTRAWRWASGIARCSAATRRWPRKLRRRRWTRNSGSG